MNKRYKIMTNALGLLLTLLVLMEALKPSPVNWNPSYSQVDKIPFGSYIFYNELKQKLEEIYPDSNIPSELMYVYTHGIDLLAELPYVR